MRRNTILLIVLLVFAGSSCSGPDAEGTAFAPQRPYVAAFTFQAPHPGFDFQQAKLMSKEQLDVFNDGGLDGWGVIYAGGTYFDRGKTVEGLKDELAFLKRNLRPGKHIWPVMFIGPMLQFVEAGVTVSGVSVSPAMRARANIPGMDLENETGAREVFEHNWRNALLIAKELGTPGIMFDAEFYFGGEYYDIAELARRRGEDEATVAAKCEAFGARLADITEDAYPGAVIFWFFTGLHNPVQEWSPVPYICLGALKRAKQIGAKQLHIDGGESGVAYLHRSVKALETRIHNRWIETRELLQQYPNFELGGVLAPYVDVKERVSWMTSDLIGKEQTAADFQPHFEALFRNYRFTWLYGTHHQGRTGFNPWGPAHSERMAVPLRRARQKAQYAPPNLAALPAEKLPEGRRYGDSGDRLDYESFNREVWIDLGYLGDAKVVRQYLRGRSVNPNAATGQGGRLIPEPVEAGGKKWTAQIEFDSSKVSGWPWPAISVTNLPVTDISGYEGMAVEVYNPNPKPLFVRFSLWTPDPYPDDQWGHLNQVIPAESAYTFSYTGVHKPIHAISFSAVRQPDALMRIYVSPVFTLR